MKNKSTTAWIIIGVLLAIVGLVVLSLYSKKDINWDEHYKANSKDPYGLFLIQELLNDKYEGKNETIVKSLHKSLPLDKNERNNNYLFIGSTLYLTDTDQKALFTFIENGNKAFIASKELPYSIAYLLKNGGTFTFDSINHFIIYPTDKTTDSSATYTISTNLEPTETTYDTTTVSENEYADSLYVDSETETVSAQPLPDENVVAEENTSAKDEEVFIEEDDDNNAQEGIKTDTIIAAIADSDTLTSIDSNIVNLSYIDDKEVHISLLKPLANSPKEYMYQSPKIEKGFLNDSASYHWLGIYGDTQLHSSCVILSRLSNVTKDTISTLVGIPYGKGMLYVCTTPMFFTNFQVKEQKGFNQAKELLSVLSPGKLYWDEVSSIQSSSGNTGINNPKAYLKYILSIDALRWAWYILLATTLIYILFESKRKLRIIPIIEPVANTSIEYVHTTGRLYAQIGNHRKLIKLNMRLFLSSIQQKYGVSVNLDDSKSIQWLAIKSGVPAERYEKLQGEYTKIMLPGHDMKTKDLHSFYQNMQFIYQKIQN